MQWSPLKAAEIAKPAASIMAKLTKIKQYWTYFPRCMFGLYESPSIARVSLSAALKLRVKKLIERAYNKNEKLEGRMMLTTYYKYKAHKPCR